MKKFMDKLADATNTGDFGNAQLQVEKPTHEVLKKNSTSLPFFIVAYFKGAFFNLLIILAALDGT